MKRIVIAVIVLCIAALSGCNTMHGLGKDIEQVGDKIQKKSQ